MNRLFALLITGLLTACGSSGPPPADWKMNAVSLMDHAQVRWLEGDAKAADLAWRKARDEIAKSARLDLAARAELAACATRMATLDFAPCTAYQPLAGDASAADQAYHRFLTAEWTNLDARLLPNHYQALATAKDEATAQRSAIEIKEPLPRLIGLALLFKQGRLGPEGMAAAVDAASERGWRRPLLAWLEIGRQRAMAAGDTAAAAYFSRRMDLTTVKGEKAE